MYVTAACTCVCTCAYINRSHDNPVGNISSARGFRKLFLTQYSRKVCRQYIIHTHIHKCRSVAAPFNFVINVCALTYAHTLLTFFLQVLTASSQAFDGFIACICCFSILVFTWVNFSKTLIIKKNISLFKKTYSIFILRLV